MRIAFPYDNLVVLGHFICSGVLERFPSCGWNTRIQHRAGYRFGSAVWTRIPTGATTPLADFEHLTMLPSEYFMRQCAATCDSDETGLQYAVAHLDGNNIVEYRLSASGWNRSRQGAARVRRAAYFRTSQAQNSVGQRGHAISVEDIERYAGVVFYATCCVAARYIHKEGWTCDWF